MTSTLLPRESADAPTQPIVIPPARRLPYSERPERVVRVSRSALVTSLVSTLVVGAAALVAILPAGSPVADVELFGSAGRPRITDDGPPTGPTRGPNDPAPTKSRKAKPGKTASKPTSAPVRPAEPGPQENDPAPVRKPASEAPAPASGRPASGSAVNPDVRPAGPSERRGDHGGIVCSSGPNAGREVVNEAACGVAPAGPSEQPRSPDAPASSPVASGASTPSASASTSPEASSASPATT